MIREQRRAVRMVADRFGWSGLSVHDCGLILWCAFRYYAIRLYEDGGDL